MIERGRARRVGAGNGIGQADAPPVEAGDRAALGQAGQRPLESGLDRDAIDRDESRVQHDCRDGAVANDDVGDAPPRCRRSEQPASSGCASGDGAGPASAAASARRSASPGSSPISASGDSCRLEGAEGTGQVATAVQRPDEQRPPMFVERFGRRCLLELGDDIARVRALDRSGQVLVHQRLVLAAPASGEGVGGDRVRQLDASSPQRPGRGQRRSCLVGTAVVEPAPGGGPVGGEESRSQAPGAARKA